jgi:hypothetical protein
MQSSNLVRSGGGLASAVAGVLLVAGHLLDLGGDPEYGAREVPGARRPRAARLRPRSALRRPGGKERSSGDSGDGARRGGNDARLRGSPGRDLWGLRGGGGRRARSGRLGHARRAGGFAFFFGLILFGLATMRAGVFPRWAGLLLIAGDVVFAAGDLAGPAAPMVFVLGAALTCAGFVWLGLALLTR